MGNIFPTPSTEEVVPLPPDWLIRAKKDVNSSVTWWNTTCSAGGLLVLGAQAVLKETEHNLNEPNYQFVSASIGTFMASLLLGKSLVNSYSNTTENPLRRVRNRVVFGLFYAASLTVPFLLFSSWFIPAEYVWQALGTAGAIGAANVARCVMTKPKGAGLQVGLHNRAPTTQNMPQNLGNILFVDPVAFGQMQNREHFVNGLQWLAARGAIMVPAGLLGVQPGVLGGGLLLGGGVQPGGGAGVQPGGLGGGLLLGGGVQPGGGAGVQPGGLFVGGGVQPGGLGGGLFVGGGVQPGGLGGGLLGGGVQPGVLGGVQPGGLGGGLFVGGGVQPGGLGGGLLIGGGVQPGGLGGGLGNGAGVQPGGLGGGAGVQPEGLGGGLLHNFEAGGGFNVIQIGEADDVADEVYGDEAQDVEANVIQIGEADDVADEVYGDEAQDVEAQDVEANVIQIAEGDDVADEVHGDEAQDGEAGEVYGDEAV